MKVLSLQDSAIPDSKSFRGGPNGTLIFRRRGPQWMAPALLAMALLLMAPLQGLAQPPQSGGEAQLILPDLSQGSFLGTDGRTLLMGGLATCELAVIVGLLTYRP